MMEIVLVIIGLLICIIPTVVWNKSVQGKTIDYELIRKRKFYKLPVNEEMTMKLVKEYLEEKNDTK